MGISGGVKVYLSLRSHTWNAVVRALRSRHSIHAAAPAAATPSNDNGPVYVPTVRERVSRLAKTWRQARIWGGGHNPKSKWAMEVEAQE